MFAMLSTVVMLAAVPPANDVAADKPETTLTLGSAVEERQVVPWQDGAPAAGDTVYAWMLIKGFGGDSVEHVWIRDGVEVARHAISVGSAKRWRSWSHHKVRAGSYEVRVVAADGTELAKQAFTVPGADDAHGE